MTEFSTTTKPGAYALIIELKRHCELSIGRLGNYQFNPGYYTYLGSALGPGGVRARVHRHLRYTKDKPTHWHVDHLLEWGKIIEVWWKPTKERVECLWAAQLAQLGNIHIPRFGASDCRCPGHLVRFEDRTALEPGFKMLGSGLFRQKIG